MQDRYAPGALGDAGGGSVIAEQQQYPADSTAHRDPATPAQLGFLLRDWRPLDNAGALVGRAAVDFGALIISDIGIFVGKDGSRWSQLPSEMQRDRNGQPLRDERGKAVYRSSLRWRDRDLQIRFSRALIEAIERRHGPIGGGP